MNRRELLRCGVAAAGGALTLRSPHSEAQWSTPAPKVLRLRIRSINAELAPGVLVRALACNDTLAGPLVHVIPNERIGIEVANDANRTVDLHGPWIGENFRLGAGERVNTVFQATSSGVGCARTFVAGPAVAGIAGMFVQPDFLHDADQVHHLSIQHWLPSLTPGAGALLAPGITYRYASLGDKLLHASEPIRVREGQRVLFHFFNASPTKCVSLSLPNHRFLVLALDGYAVPRPRAVNHVFLGPGERVAAVVHMGSPGRFVLGSIDRRDRGAGFGRVIEYTHAGGAYRHADIQRLVWDYGAFGGEEIRTAGSATVIPIEFIPASGGATQIDAYPLQLDGGSRYRLSLVNATGEHHCVSLRGHSFELTSVAGNAVRGIVKDTIALPTFARTEIEFVAANSTVDLLHAPSVAVSKPAHDG